VQLGLQALLLGATFWDLFSPDKQERIVQVQLAGALEGEGVISKKFALSTSLSTPSEKVVN
jgi:hypothetical protein